MTRFIERILRMPRVVMTIMALLLLAGGLSYSVLPKESFPAIDVPYLYVSISQTGVSPRDAENLLAKPAEEELNGLDGLVNMTSTSTTGHASVVLEFDANVETDQALADTRARVDAIKANLPDDATDPTVNEIDMVGFPIISVAVYGDVPERELVRRAEELQTALEGIGAVREVTLSGARDEVVEVTIDLMRLEAYNLTANQLFDALARNNLVVPGGTINTGQGSFSVEVPGLITSAQDVFELPIKTDGNSVVTFGDIANVTRTLEDATEYTNVNGSPALILGVSKKAGTNIIEVSDTVRAVTEETAAQWPQGVGHSFFLDQAETTIQLFRSLEAAVLTAVALVLITCVAVLGPRAAFMIGMSIPLSFMIAFLYMQMTGMTINMMVMFGLVIAVGVLVDDPVVVVEYAERKLQEGVSKKEAFIQAMHKMFIPVIGATATTLAAFVPLLFWPGIIGKFMTDLPTIVIVVMSASFISALIFMPVIGAVIASTHVDPERKEQADIVMYPEKFHPKKVKGLTGVYVRIMSVLLRWPVPTLLVGFGIVFGVFFTYAANPTGVEAFPASEPEYATVAVVARGNYSPEEVRDMLVEVEDELMQVHGIRDIIMQFGTTGAMGTMPPDTIGNFQLQLIDYNNRVKAEEIFTDIRQRVADISGLQVQVLATESGPPAGKDINMRVESTNYDTLAPTVARIREYLEDELPNTADIEDGRPSPGIDWQVTVDRLEAARYGIGVRELAPYVQLVTSGVDLGTYRDQQTGDELDIKVRLPQDERTLDALDSMRIATSEGMVPVSNFIERQAVPRVANIERRNQVYVMPIAANLVNLPEGVYPATRVAELQAWLDGQEWPDGVTFAFGGAEEQMGDANAFIGQAFGAAVFLIFLILLLEYNSFYQVFVTLSTVFMSVAGVLLGMLATGMSFSAIMTGLGVVALAGIVVKNGIVLIDTYNEYNRHQQVEPVTAMLLTAAQRVRPVLLTAFLTALGVIPMWANIEFDFLRREIVVGGIAGSWFIHLSAALVSGLFFSTALTLIMVPVMITAPKVIKSQVASVFNWVRGRRAEEAAPSGFDGMAVEVAGDDTARKHIVTKDTELIERNENGVTVLSRRPAAE
ncbi:efflux RND transporter permease subunit [Pelagibacterium halotolerans]|uniref:Transporter, AcrB/AcrD/AcrF family protein n=1 Tax=Pelagibacterium halotolerans (strain DSM 22347 / JCM 15775 / CGMCC 1.7692 / B2) TaxID=1082931 RepID=G4RF68_PELHB|nr:efflux RND transporter permease subunit [Pelagibacterium halotolerans]AEQ50936.1 transporter, AcrB/AcrD/AcrF family protein [Pelagibacterium halotolerans B2]QJR19165.1 efflux RND transporter permease subunit [Pelagibacterium halotolerans]SEA00418.1 multidrug efflux pump [Pelagibacterium halotolerans]